jgi:hypothetical protein
MAPRARRSLTIQLRSAADPGIAGLVEDLALPAGRREAALAAAAQGELEIQQAAAASVEGLRDDMRTLLAQDQLAMLDGALEAHAKTLRTLVGASRAPAGRPSLPLPRVQVDRAIRNLGLSGQTFVTLDAAFGRHLDRVRVVASDRSGLLRKLTPVLTADELTDFAAALERHAPAAITVEAVPPQ